MNTSSSRLPLGRVVVCGGGVAGVAAALAARRGGADAILLEKGCLLGGLATIGIINFFVPMCNGRGRQVARGMADEFLRLSIRHGFDTLPPYWRHELGFDTHQDLAGRCAPPPHLTTSFSAQIFALELLGLLNREGVEVRFDELVCGVEKDKEGRILAVLCEDKGGRRRFAGDVFIDATGDADLCVRAGAPCEAGINYFSYFGREITLESCARAARSGNIADAYVGCSGGNASLSGVGHPAGMRTFRGGDPDDLSDFLVRNQLVLLEKLSADADRRAREVVTLPTMPQLRTTRHLVGNATLTTDDKYRHCPDSIATISDFNTPGFLYEVPWGTLVRTGFPNLVAVGRCASATGYAWNVLRVIPPAILTGQAAGTAAALALAGGPLPNLPATDIPALQRALETAGSPVHIDPALLPSGKDTASPENRAASAANGQLTPE